jgi:UDP-galactopyranose mutase
MDGAAVEFMTTSRRPLLCFSHLRWNFVYQRPQHLLTRCARQQRVYYFEEPHFTGTMPRLEVTPTASGVTVVVPHLPPGMGPVAIEEARRELIEGFIDSEAIEAPVLWYYTPMALPYTERITCSARVYDCMDELSLFMDAPPALQELERRLLVMADVVFTGGQTLYEYKKATSQHQNIHAFPSSVDVPHFAQARAIDTDPVDQAAIPHPRVGFFGVIDERMDLALLGGLADLRPDLQFVMIGPVVKIAEDSRPFRGNIHWLGSRSYDELPAYLSGWDVALLPFALNESTRFISPTKTPEYLAAGRPVVSTSITDVVTPYGDEGLVWIADSVDAMSEAIDEALASDRPARQRHVDAFLSQTSWDRTWYEMWRHVEIAVVRRARRVMAAPATERRRVEPPPDRRKAELPLGASRLMSGRGASMPSRRLMDNG